MKFKGQHSIIFLIFFLISCAYLPLNLKDSSLQVKKDEKPLLQVQAEKEIAEKQSIEQDQQKEVPKEVPLETKTDEELESLFARANEFFKKGVDFSDKGDWIQAEDEFENALECLQDSSLVNEYPDDINKFYNRMIEDILSIIAKKEESAEKLKESILSANIKAKPEEEMTIKEKIAMDLKEILFDVPVEINQKVIDYVEYFTFERKESVARWLSRSNIYLQTMQKIFSQKGLPRDLTYLPLIESAFNPDAYSYAKACGLWQFIPGTARKYGLIINWWIDERKDFEKSTHAAADYLKALYEMFNDWRLALAAYNAGEGRIAKAIQTQKTTNFWELNLHPQTKNYIPAYMASLLIAKNPRRYGLDVTYEPALDYDTVVLRSPVDLRTIAEGTGTTRGIIRKLNPEIRSSTTPPNTKDYLLRIPAGTKERFEIELAKVEEKNRVAWGSYRIKKNETLTNVARKFNVPIKALMAANSISNPHKIAEGQRIIVPNRYERLASASSDSQNQPSNSQKKRKLSIYTVKKGDNLSEIARLHNVSPKSIKKWNNLKSRKNLYPNQKLKIYSSKLSSGELTKEAGEKYANIGNNFKEIIYVVKKGDTLWNIAKLYNISTQEIVEINNIQAKNSLMPGEKLKIKIPQQL